MHKGAEIPQQYHLKLFKCNKIICILTGYWIDALQLLQMNPFGYYREILHLLTKINQSINQSMFTIGV